MWKVVNSNIQIHTHTHKENKEQLGQAKQSKNNQVVTVSILHQLNFIVLSPMSERVRAYDDLDASLVL